jgi:hypothetical protein
MISYFTNNPITVAGRQIFVQYSNYKALITDPSNTNNQIAKAALDMAKELHKAAQTGGQNTVLRAMIQNMLYTVTLDTIYQIFSRYGPVLKIITFTKNGMLSRGPGFETFGLNFFPDLVDKYQALIQMKDAQSAQSAKNSLHGQNVYSGCCTLHIDYSKLNTLNVKYNNEKSRDYTNPLLPAGDLNSDPLGLGISGILSAAAAAAVASPLQLSMGPPPSTYTTAPQFHTLQPAYHHLAQSNFDSYTWTEPKSPLSGRLAKPFELIFSFYQNLRCTKSVSNISKVHGTANTYNRKWHDHSTNIEPTGQYSASAPTSPSSATNRTR